MDTDKEFLKLALSRDVSIRAIKVALFVGTLLALINYGGKLLSFEINGQDLFKIILTYFVPYSVSTWSSVKAMQDKP